MERYLSRYGQPDIVFLQEIGGNTVKIQNYKMFASQDSVRGDRRHVRTAVMIRKGVFLKIEPKSLTSVTSFATLPAYCLSLALVQVTLKSGKIMVVGSVYVYSKLRKAAQGAVYNVLCSVLRLYPDIVLGGDYNTYKPNHVLLKKSLPHPAIYIKPNKKTHTGGSILDYFIVQGGQNGGNQWKRLAKFSDHYGVSLALFTWTFPIDAVGIKQFERSLKYGGVPAFASKRFLENNHSVW